MLSNDQIAKLISDLKSIQDQLAHELIRSSETDPHKLGKYRGRYVAIEEMKQMLANADKHPNQKDDHDDA